MSTDGDVAAMHLRFPAFSYSWLRAATLSESAVGLRKVAADVSSQRTLFIKSTVKRNGGFVNNRSLTGNHVGGRLQMLHGANIDHCKLKSPTINNRQGKGRGQRSETRPLRRVAC